MRHNTNPGMELQAALHGIRKSVNRRFDISENYHKKISERESFLFLRPECYFGVENTLKLDKGLRLDHSNYLAVLKEQSPKKFLALRHP